MNGFKFILLILITTALGMPTYSQENSAIPKRTPEQEATKQTEKLQQELDLNQDQAKEIYLINLRYARERQISNKRSEALERMKNKNADIEHVLSPEQSYRLQTKRYERTYLETNTLKQNQSNNPAGFRSSSSFRSSQAVRVPASSETNSRNNYRPVNPNFHPGIQHDQIIRRRTNTAPQTTHFQNNPSSRSSSGNNTHAPRRTEIGVQLHNNSSNTRNQTTPAYTPRRTETPVNPNRK